MNKITSLLLISFFFSTANMAFAKNAPLSLPKANSINYQCSNGLKINVNYYNLSDNSLSFVKFTLNKEEYTLPQVVSGSGSRYTDLHKVEWHEERGDALLNEDINNKKSKLIECKEKPTANKK